MLSNCPDWMLIQIGDDEEMNDDFGGFSYSAYKELDLRRPDEATFYFGDCAGEAGFLPIEEYDNKGQLIKSEVILYDEE